MRLSDLLEYDDIVIQCHDNPDADALSSGFALYRFFESRGKNPLFIYRGKNEIKKSNLLIMIDKLHIPVNYEPDFDKTPRLLITCDCQYGQRNVTHTDALTVAVIDHHQVTTDLPPLNEVRSSIGSCSTVIWDMLRDEGFDIKSDKDLMTALYYGLYTDTGKLSQMSHPLDRDMADALDYNGSLITKMSNSNITLDELRLTGKAIIDYDFYEDIHTLVIQSEPCDPNILGVISDFSMETVGVDICVAYYDSPDEVKFSVRTCTNEVHANEFAAFLADGLGGGGGHILKAGGTIRPELLSKPASDVILERIRSYFDKYEIIYAKDTTLPVSDFGLYSKREQKLGAVRLADIFPTGTKVEIRTLEGDVNVVITEDTFLMIGIEGEVYPISAQKLSGSYELTGFSYSRIFEYEPSVKDLQSEKIVKVMPYAKTVISPPGAARIFAKKLDRHIKLFTVWDDEKYYTGTPDDYIAVRQDDPHDIYVINGRLFHELYKPAGKAFSFP